MCVREGAGVPTNSESIPSRGLPRFDHFNPFSALVDAAKDDIAGEAPDPQEGRRGRIPHAERSETDRPEDALSLARSLVSATGVSRPKGSDVQITGVLGASHGSAASCSVAEAAFPVVDVGMTAKRKKMTKIRRPQLQRKRKIRCSTTARNSQPFERQFLYP